MKILIIGSGGHAKVVIEACELQGKYEIVGLLDDFEKVGTVKHGYPIVGRIEQATKLLIETNAKSVFSAVGDNRERCLLLESNTTEIPYVSIIHPAATISKTSLIDSQVFINASAVVNAQAKINKGAIINTGAIVEHDVFIGSYSSMGPNSVLGGGSTLGVGSHLGIGACVKHGVCVSANTIIGMGSVVVSNIRNGVVAYGNPCKVIREREIGERYL